MAILMIATRYMAMELNVEMPPLEITSTIILRG